MVVVAAGSVAATSPRHATGHQGSLQNNGSRDLFSRFDRADSAASAPGGPSAGAGPWLPRPGLVDARISPSIWYRIGYQRIPGDCPTAAHPVAFSGWLVARTGIDDCPGGNKNTVFASGPWRNWKTQWT